MIKINGKADALIAREKRIAAWHAVLILRALPLSADAGEAYLSAGLALEVQPEPPLELNINVNLFDPEKVAESVAPPVTVEKKKFSTTQFNLADAGYTRTQGSPLPKIKKMAASIKDDDLGEDGREENLHITVKYGLHADNEDEVAAIVKDFGPVNVVLGETFIFPASGDHDFDVVNIAVESGDLRRLNKLIADSLEHTDTHPEYVPHVCLAYVKAGKGKKYVGMDDVDGDKLSFGDLVFSSKSREKTDVQLSLLGDGAALSGSSRENSLASFFDPDEHPRNELGEFAKKGTAPTSQATAAPKVNDDEPPDDLPAPESFPAGEPRKSKTGSIWIKAKAGGEVSPVNGQHYKGGRWMPIHGLSPKQTEKPKAKESQGGDMPKPPDEDSGRQRAARQPMTPEQIEEERQHRADSAKGDMVRQSPLRDMLTMAQHGPVHQLKRTQPGWKHWKEFAEKAGESGLGHVISQLEGAADQEDIDNELSHPQGFAASASNAHLARVPASAKAYAHVVAALDKNNNVEGIHRVATALSEALQGATPLSLSAYLSWDIFSRPAQGVLNRALSAAKKLSASARSALTDALALEEPSAVGAAVVAFLQKYRVQLADLLTNTQLAAVLQGAREVAKSLPEIPPAGTAPPPPPTLEPKRAQELLDELRALPDDARALRIYQLPADQQNYVQSSLQYLGARPPQESPPPVPPPSQEGEAGAGDGVDLHFPVIDEAAAELSSKNVMGRHEFDQLEAAARQKAFTIAGVDAQQTLLRVRDALAENVRDGADFKTFKDMILDDVEKGTFLGDAHLCNIFRTNVQAAFSDGQMKVLEHPFVRSGFPYIDYEAIHDDRVEPEHLAMETYGIGGTSIYRADDPVIKLFRPPWRWMCRCSWIPMTVRHAAERGIQEAIDWLRTGVEPTPRAYVEMPPFQPPPGFRRSLADAPLAIRLSLVDADSFLAIEDAAGHLHSEANGRFVEKDLGGFSPGKGQGGYIRFGDKPEGEGNSTNNIEDVEEDGLSVFRIREDDEGPYFYSGQTDMKPLMERPSFLLDGYELGTGADGEPLLRPDDATAVKKVRIVQDGRKWRIVDFDSANDKSAGAAFGCNFSRRTLQEASVLLAMGGTFLETEHPRGQPQNKGQFGSKESNPAAPAPAPAAPLPATSHDQDHPQEDSSLKKSKALVKRYAAKLSHAADKIPVVGQIKSKMTKAMEMIHATAAKRYGPNTAKIIMASGTVMDIALMAGGTALTGVPVVTGFNQLIGIIPAFVLAEGKYLITGGKKFSQQEQDQGEEDEAGGAMVLAPEEFQVENLARSGERSQVFNITVNIPEQKPPDLTVNIEPAQVTVNVPEQPKQEPPVVNILAGAPAPAGSEVGKDLLGKRTITKTARRNDDGTVTIDITEEII